MRSFASDPRTGDDILIGLPRAGFGEQFPAATPLSLCAVNGFMRYLALVEPGLQVTNMTYDAGPRADTPIFVEKPKETQ